MDEIESQDVATEADETLEEPTVPESEPEENTTEEPQKPEKAPETPQQKAARLKRQYERALKEAGESVEEPPQKKDGLDDVEALLLEVKGVQDPEDVALFEKWKADTGRSAREILSNDIFQKEVAAQKAKREVRDATPSSTRRHGGTGDNLARAVAKFKQTGELPNDFAMRSAVTNAVLEESNPNKPAWHS